MLQIHLHCNRKGCAGDTGEQRLQGLYGSVHYMQKKECHKKCNGLKLLTFPYMRNLWEINEAHLHAGWTLICCLVKIPKSS